MANNSKKYTDIFSLKNRTAFIIGGQGLLGSEIVKAIMYIKSIIFLFCTTFAYSQDYTYLLEDINTSSDYYGNYVSPSGFNEQVTLHYFGHQN